MAKIFWVTCPKCDKRFYASVDDFQGQDRNMMCPFCEGRFTDEEAKEKEKEKRGSHG
ncbi:MAG: hypothetical protein LBK98_04860 [Peptococcaceae bacterium]|jgi:uncharacterized Zn-finger protein|nr:hypothetical protein [Peptococcaceae bacterium]